ncbi:MAG: RNA-binding S4 domain-containing protein [Clostridia bacterium]|nr:RNA-binding S4 domain-containing protein [Clostridia bacterium]
MRLDKYLKVARIIKRRTVANEACDAERIEVNGKRAKASYEVKTGDVIRVTFGTRTLSFRVLDVQETVGKAEASSLYEVISEE